LVERVHRQPDDLSPWFDLFEWEPREARSTLPLGEPLELGGALAYVGADLRTPRVAPGEEIVLITFWEPLALPSPGQEIVLFTHLLDAGEVIAQQDRLDVPPSFWSLGDLFAQLHRVPVPEELTPGSYPLEGGAFWRTEGYPRLPVVEDGTVVGDRFLLPEVEVLPPEE
jgi:hypothetical protein